MAENVDWDKMGNVCFEASFSQKRNNGPCQDSGCDVVLARRIDPAPMGVCNNAKVATMYKPIAELDGGVAKAIEISQKQRSHCQRDRVPQARHQQIRQT